MAGTVAERLCAISNHVLVCWERRSHFLYGLLHDEDLGICTASGIQLKSTPSKSSKSAKHSTVEEGQDI